MSIDKYHNPQYGTLGGSNVPLRTGDRRWSQDRSRDFRYLQDQVGSLASVVLSGTPCIVNGGAVTQGSGLNLNIALGYGYAKFEIDIVDSFASLPPTVTQEDIQAIKISWPAQTNMNASSSYCSTFSTVDDSTTINYVKCRYIERDGNTRTRAKYSGSYAYEVLPSYDFIVDSVAPTDYDIVLDAFTSDGATYSFVSGYRSVAYLSDDLKYTIASQADFESVIERTGANAYRFKNEYTGIYMKAGIYDFTACLSGGDTWGALSTNNVVHWEAERLIGDTYITLGDTASYINVNTAGCYLKNLYVKGTNSVAAAVTRTFLLAASNITFDICIVSSRLSNTTMNGFEGSATAVNNDTSKYLNCRVSTLESSSVAVRGFYKAHNLINCSANALTGTAATAVSAFSLCVNGTNLKAWDLDAVNSSSVGIDTCKNISNFEIWDLDTSGTGSSYGVYASERISNGYIYDLAAASGNPVYGIHSTTGIDNIKIYQLDTTGTGIAYGAYQVDGIETAEFDDIDSVSGNAYGMYDCDNVGGSCTIGTVTSSGATAYDFYACSTNITDNLYITSDGKLATGGETSPDVDAGGLCLNHGSNDGNVLTFKNSDVNQSTGIGESDTYGRILKGNSTNGGLRIDGMSASYIGMLLSAGVGSSNLSEGVNAMGAFHLQTSVGMSSGANLFVVANGSAACFSIKGDGDFTYDGSGSSYDNENDIMLARAMQYEMAGWDKRVIQEHSDRLHELGVMANGFISRKKLDALTLGTMSQMFNIFRHMAKRLDITEAELFDMARDYN